MLGSKLQLVPEASFLWHFQSPLEMGGQSRLHSSRGSSVFGGGLSQAGLPWMLQGLAGLLHSPGTWHASQAADVGKALQFLREVIFVEHGVSSVLHHLEGHRPEDGSKLIDAFRPLHHVSLV